MTDAEIYTPELQPQATVLEEREKMTPTAEKLYAIYDKARSEFRAFIATHKVPKGATVVSVPIEDILSAASDSKKDE